MADIDTPSPARPPEPSGSTVHSPLLECCQFAPRAGSDARPDIRRVYAVIVRQDQSDPALLLASRFPPAGGRGNYYHLPGGALEPGEDPVQGLRRLLNDQFKLQAAQISPFGPELEAAHESRNSGTGAAQAFVVALSGEPAPRPVWRDGLAGYAWVPPDELEKHVVAEPDSDAVIPDGARMQCLVQAAFEYAENERRLAPRPPKDDEAGGAAEDAGAAAAEKDALGRFLDACRRLLAPDDGDKDRKRG